MTIECVHRLAAGIGEIVLDNDDVAIKVSGRAKLGRGILAGKVHIAIRYRLNRNARRVRKVDAVMDTFITVITRPVRIIPRPIGNLIIGKGSPQNVVIDENRDGWGSGWAKRR